MHYWTIDGKTVSEYKPDADEVKLNQNAHGKNLQYVSIGLGNGLTSNGRQAINWNNDDPLGECMRHQWHPLQTWFSFNPSMDK